MQQARRVHAAQKRTAKFKAPNVCCADKAALGSPKKHSKRQGRQLALHRRRQCRDGTPPAIAKFV